ncbi:MAG: tyrosine-type recombinase/integrase [Lawsonibacter sp.]
MNIMSPPHQLRHAFATTLFEAGIEEKDAQELLGHSSITLTHDVYTHIRSARKEKTASCLNEYLAQDEAEK